RFNAMRAAGDPLADDTVAAIFAAGDRELVNKLMPLLHNPESWPPETPSELAAYLAQSQQLPSWADPVVLKRAYQFLAVQAIPYNIVLLYLSLPIMNAWQVGGAQTLALTGQLTQHFARRLSETLRFVRAVIAEQGMSETGNGIRTTQKVRLMHDTIRHYAQSAQCPTDRGYWNPAWGKPINQEALTATMLAFSTVAVQGLRKFDIRVSEQDESDLLHLWKVIGHILGIDDANMPATVQEAGWLWHKFAQRNFGASNAGKLLTQAHIDFMRNIVQGDAMLHRELARTDEALLRYLLGRRIATGMLGVKRPGLTGIVVIFLRDMFGMAEIIVDIDVPLDHWLENNAEAILKKLQEFWDHFDGTRPFHMPSTRDGEGGLARACAMEAS
ncbi:MAG: DUF2236 domain-containing protein, partial [Burkholderiaceae bacterium]|nr:DUF2236 domain-containing protein [Burkholderiaceae bacterium]